MKTKIERAIILAESRGAKTSATTVRGILRAVRATPRPTRYLPPADPTVNTRLRSVGVRQFLAGVAARKLDSEAKRAAADPAFRSGYLRGLRRAEKRLIAPVPATPAAITAARSQRAALTGQLKNIARLRSIATRKTCAAAALPQNPEHHIVSVSVEAAKLTGAQIIMRGIDASLCECVLPSHGQHSEARTEWDQKGRPHHVRAVHDNFVRSLAVIASPRVLLYGLHESEYAIELPDGYHWAADSNGVKSVMTASTADDYHPDARDLISPEAAGKIVGILQKNRETRLAMAAKTASDLAEMEGTWVCLADSLRAGNCRAGSDSFAARHGIDPARHYHAPELLAMTVGDSGRVRLAITAARIRHRREMAAGLAVLAEHSA